MNLKYNNSASIDLIAMILPPFESSHGDESNGIEFIEIRSLDIKIVKFEFSYYLLIIKVT